MKINKLILLFTSFLLVACLSIFAVFNSAKNEEPSKLVKKYWKLCLKGKLEQAKSLKSDASSTSPIGEDGTAISGNVVYADGTIKDCCYGKEISEKKLKITKIVEFQQKKHNAVVIVEAEDKDSKKQTYTNCLSRFGDNWIITDVSPQYDINQSADCFPK